MHSLHSFLKHAIDAEKIVNLRFGQYPYSQTGSLTGTTPCQLQTVLVRLVNETRKYFKTAARISFDKSMKLYFFLHEYCLRMCSNLPIENT